MRVRFSSVWPSLKTGGARRALAAAAVLLLAGLIGAAHFGASAASPDKTSADPKGSVSPPNSGLIELSDAQLGMITRRSPLAPIDLLECEFRAERIKELYRELTLKPRHAREWPSVQRHRRKKLPHHQAA